jgi:lipid II:glycine glycyltransferase (peptidoglycan interpeptide bridge formation enzyme)
MTRNKAQKKYFFSCDYFQVFINKNAEHCALALIYKDGIPISTELVLLSDDTLYSHLGGTDASYFASRPNDFLKFEVMKWAMEQKKKYYILGGGREIGDDLYKYKKNYFPNDDDIIYYTGRKIILSEVSKILNEYQKLNNFELYSANVENDYFPAYRIK